MHPALWISKTGLDAQQTDISVISNNLANVNTTAYKKGRAIFKDLLYQNVRQPGGEAAGGSELPSGLMLGTGVQLVATEKDFATLGSPVKTDNPYDMAIDGRGFFQVTMPDGTTAYTRDGKFTPDSSGNLVTSDGLQLSPAITIPPQAKQLTIAKDGTVSATLSGSTTPSTIGNIQVADFINPIGLQPIGDNLYIETAASGTPTVGTPGSTGFGNILQSTLESSNVNVVEELVNLIQAQRAYEMNAKSIESVENMLQFVAQVL